MRSATGVECIDEMVQKLTSRFMIKPLPKETNDSGTNTSFEENQENVENLEFSMNSGVESEKEDEEIITPRMMQDITNTMESPRVTPKGSPSKILKPGFKSGRPLNPVVVPVISKFDNPSLTQDINEIIKREEGFTKILESRREHFNQNRQDHNRQNHNDHQPGNENVHVNILENINENPVQVSAAGENLTKIKHFDIDGNMSILEEYEKNLTHHHIMSVLFILFGLLAAADARSLFEDLCENPPVPSNFTFDGLQGLWYEIGKFQTPGGAIWQENCVCTTMDMDHYDRVTGDSRVTYACKDTLPQGDVISFTGNLVDMQEPGKWTQKVFPLIPGVSWQVIVLGDNYAATYDCGSSIAGTEYCVHFVSRSPTLDQQTLDAMKTYATDLGLNPLELELDEINHENCW